MNNHTTIPGDLILINEAEIKTSRMINPHNAYNTWVLCGIGNYLNRDELCGLVVAARSDEVATTAYMITPTRIGWAELWRNEPWKVLERPEPL